MKIFYSFFFIRDRIPTKQILKTLLFSLVLVGFSKTPVSACVVGYKESILLDEVYEVLETIPEKLEQATFKGDIELTRVTSFKYSDGFNDTVIARAIVHKSETHPQFVGKKMMFFYYENLCHYTISRPGDRGLAMGRALKLGSEVLYVVPYVLSYDELEILTEDESIPLQEFYPDGYW